MKPKYVLLAVSSILFLCYQNFSPLSEEDRRTLEMMQEMKELQKHEQGPKLAAPRGGRDLASVGSNWAEQQSNLWLDGADQRFLDSVNERIEGWFRSDTNADTEESEQEGKSLLSDSEEPQKFRFARINSMEYKWDQSTLLTCSVESDGAHIDYSKSFSQNGHIGIAHKSSENETQVLIKYNW
ncbi:hypothetical protein [Bdellovibrio sp. HCB2-146]|uniref:hypothetical protein n=1 Tax=Bdellovibrio sp. HCB2-146 TaxID=3394362 RepID=UPI0039BCADBE